MRDRLSRLAAGMLVLALFALGLFSMGLVWSAGSAQAQPTGNSPVPGLAPYVPKPPPAPNAAKPAGAAVGPGGVALTPGGGISEPDYVLGPGDILRITVFGEDNLSGQFTVAGNGLLSFPLIGDVKASGQTVRAIQGEIQEALKEGYLKDPRVSAEVLTFRPYYILGEVARPGEYPYSNGITVLNAVATAGGFTYRANHHVVMVKRANEAAEHKERLKDDLQIQPGDTIRVLERYF